MTISSSWLMSMTSDTSFRLWRSAAPRSMRSPSSPSPWKLYGELRGLKAPPRSTFAPARFTAAAAASTCSSFSAEQGPAMTITSSPPIRTSPIEIDAVLRLERAARELVRLGDAEHFLHAVEHFEQPRIAAARLPPTAPITVRSAPVDRCTSKPISTSCAITRCTCSSRRPFLHHYNHNDLIPSSSDSFRSARFAERALPRPSDLDPS